MVGRVNATCGTILKDHNVRKVEKHWSRDLSAR